MRWHRHDAVCADLLRVAAERGSWQRVAGGRRRADHRDLPAGLADDDLDPALALVVRERGELAGIGRPDQAARAGLDAEADLLTQAGLVQLISIGERRNDDHENAAPGLAHDD